MSCNGYTKVGKQYHDCFEDLNKTSALIRCVRTIYALVFQTRLYLKFEKYIHSGSKSTDLKYVY